MFRVIAFLTTVITFSFAVADCPTLCAQDEPTVESIIDLHLKSIGNLEDIKAVKSMSIKATMTIPTSNGEMEAEMKRVQDGNRFAMEMVIPQFGQINTGFNGEFAWISDPISGDKLLNQSELETLRNQVPEPFPALRWIDDFDGEITLQGSEEVNGVDTFQVLFAPTDGPKITRFFNQQNGQIAKIVMVQPSPLGGDMTLELTPSNYKVVDGLSVPHTHATQTPEGRMTMHIVELKINAKTDEETFAMPESVKKLIDKKD